MSRANGWWCDGVSKTDDTDGDGIPDIADGFNRDGVAENADDEDQTTFTQLILEVPAPIDLNVAQIKIFYEDSDPKGTTITAYDFYNLAVPNHGKLRIWTKDGGEARNADSVTMGGDYVPTGLYSAEELGLSDENRTVTLYVEGIDVGRDRIWVEIDPDGVGPLGFIIEDAVRTVGVRIGLSVDNDLHIDEDELHLYEPGYHEGEAVLSTGSDFNSAQYQGQAMKIIAEGIGTGMGIDLVHFVILDSTKYNGYAGNATDSIIADSQGNDDYSFNEEEDDLVESGTMLTDRAYVDFWAKDYAGWAQIKVEFYQSQQVVFTWIFEVPLDKDGDKIADIWEKRMVTEWNAQYGAQGEITLAFFNAGNDQERRDQDGANVDGGRDLPQHATSGDRLTVLDEYRGYILDGGYDNFSGGHKRLSPAAKEFLLEVDAMDGVANMPNLAGIKDWMDEIAQAMGDVDDGIGVRMFYVIDNIATAHNIFTPGMQTQDQQIGVYASVNEHKWMSDTGKFRHLLLIDEYDGNPDRYGLTAGDASWITYAVDSGNTTSTNYGAIPSSMITHEIHHAMINNAGSDGGEHFNDTDGNGISGEASDKLLVLWNYNYNYPSTKLDGAIGAGELMSLTLTSTANMTTTGIIRIGAEWIRYDDIIGNTLLGIDRGFLGTAPAPHGDMDDVFPIYSDEELKQIKYGNGTIRLIDLQ